MSPKYWTTSEFKKLQKEWERRLEVSGCRSVEDTRGQLRSKWSTYSVERAEYYNVLTKRVNESTFDNVADRFIMQKWSDGAYVKDIQLGLKLMGKGKDRKTIWKIVKKYETRWKIKRVPHT